MLTSYGSESIFLQKPQRKSIHLSTLRNGFFVIEEGTLFLAGIRAISTVCGTTQLKETSDIPTHIYALSHRGILLQSSEI